MSLVLVIDDSAGFRDELERALAGAGYKTVGAASGPEGLHLAASLRPAAVIVDGIMPGMDGSTVIRRIRLDPALRATPCLMLTSAGEERAELTALDAGADASARKTEDVEDVVTRLGAMLRGDRAAEPAPPPQPRRVLAVDDSPLYLGALGGLLRDQGYDVVLAASGEEAIEVLAAQEVDCILLDCMMPGIGGIETCSRIKAAPMIGDVPVIMLTMLDGGDSMIEGLTAGADDYIAKSAGFDVINARIQAQIRRKRTEDARRRVRERLLHGERRAAEARGARELAAVRAELAEQLERAVAERDADRRVIQELVHWLSDLKSLLRSISGISRVLEAPLDEERLDQLRQIQAGAAHMGEDVDLLRALAVIGHGPVEVGRVDVAELVASVVEGLAADGRSVAVRVTPGLTLQGDPELVRVLFENLLSSSWKLTARTPDATIEVGRREDRTYFVRDNGLGFDAANADRLFLPFHRMRPGTELDGLGGELAIARQVVARHGGRIWAESAAGAGTTFCFTLS